MKKVVIPDWSVVIISKCHPEPFGVAQDKLHEGSKVSRNLV